MAPFKPFFNALFREGSLTKEIDLGMDMDTVKKLDKKFFDQGFRLSFLYRGDGSYQAAWEHGGGAQFWLSTDDFDELKSTEKKHAKHGLRFKYLHAEEGHFIAIWHPGSGQQFWEVNIGFDAFKTLDEGFRSQGLMLMKMCDDSGKYSGFWQPGTKKYDWISTSHEDQFDAFTLENQKKGLLGVSFGGAQRCAVYHQEGGDQRFVGPLAEKDFTNKAEALFKENFHIVDLYMTYGNSN